MSSVGVSDSSAYCGMTDKREIRALTSLTRRLDLIEDSKTDVYSTWELPLDAQELTFLDIKEKLVEHYSRESFVVNDDYGRKRYAYYDSNTQQPGFGETHSIIEDLNCAMFGREVISKWQTLREKEKRNLFLMLYCAKCISFRLVFSFKSDRWEKRMKDSFRYTQTCLNRYGKKIQDGSDVLTYLAGGNIPECINQTYDVTFELDVSWMFALMGGMKNGSARTAICNLLTKIKNLLHGLAEKDKFPRVWLLNETSSTAEDGMSISSASTSCSSEHERTRVEMEPSRKRKYDERDPKRRATSVVEAKRHRTDEERDVSQDGEAETKESSGHRHYVDLALVCHEHMSGRVYYLLLIEILSHPKTMEKAKEEFKEEMVHVLQSQEIVFGILFGPREIILYKAERKQSGEIYFGSTKYELIHKLEESGLPYGNFHAGSFQWMIMDILSSLIESIRVLCEP